MGRFLKINSLLKLMFAICMGTQLYIASLVWMATRAVVEGLGARNFLNTCNSLPPDTWRTLITLSICIFLFSITFGLRLYVKIPLWNSICLGADFFLALFCVLLLNYSYNGVMLWSIVNALIYLKQNKMAGFIMGGGILAYLLTTPDVAGFTRRRFNFSSYAAVFPDLQGILLSLYSLLTILTIAVFICCCVIIIVAKEETIEQNQELNQRLTKANEDLKRANKALEGFVEEKARLAEIKERNRIAREIHDTLGHTLTGIAAGLDACMALAGDSSQILKNQLKILSEVSRKGIKDIRLSVRSLRPDAPQRLDLKNALEELVENTKVVTGVEVDFQCNVQSMKYDEDEENAIYRIVQESITNAIRHGGADKIQISIQARGFAIYLRIKDNGRGCENIEAGFGLRHIRERIAMLRGQVSFDGRDGFLVEALIPIRWGEEYD